MTKMLNCRRDVLIAADAINTSGARGQSHQDTVIEALKQLEKPIDGKDNRIIKSEDNYFIRHQFRILEEKVKIYKLHPSTY